ncbi:MAG: hypothetical protein JW820_16140 [Spirochaetales bacterium]|nr:hypothetical protein [Spirochaetales bacterium]
MPEPGTRRELEREAEGHITLGTLLRREREEPRRLAVERVMASSLSTAQKIERIQAIDEEQDEQGVQRVLRAAAEQAGRQQASRVLRSVKVSRPRAGYLRYLLRERRLLQRFGRETHVLEARLLPPGVRPEPALQSFLVRQLQAWAGELSEKLAPVREAGWLYLSRRRYNLAVLLERLCERIAAFDFVHLDYRDRDLVDKMRRIESLFLALHYRPEYLEELVGAGQVVYSKQGKTEEADRVTDLINRILLPDLTLPSLYNVLLGLNMVRERRYLALADLVREGLGEPISSGEFDCGPKVRKRMEEYIQTAVDSVKRLHGQLFEVRRLNSYITYDEQGQPDTTALRELYETPEGRGRGNFDADQENLLLFAVRFLRTFDRTFFPLLNGQLTLAGVGKAQIFSRGFFQVEFSRLRAILERLEKGSFHFTHFPLKRYFQIKEGELRPVGTEAEVAQLMDDQVATLVDLGKTLSRLLSLQGLGAVPPGGSEPLEPIVLQGKPFKVPHASVRIQSRTMLNGRTVEEALAIAVSVCFSAGLYLRDRFVYYFLGRERKYAAEIEARMSSLENVLDPGSMVELRALYG